MSHGSYTYSDFLGSICQHAHIHVLADFLKYFKVVFLGFMLEKSHNLKGQGIFRGDQDFFLSLNCPKCNPPPPPQPAPTT
jgi:hypothetical protein